MIKYKTLGGFGENSVSSLSSGTDLSFRTLGPSFDVSMYNAIFRDQLYLKPEDNFYGLLN